MTLPLELFGDMLRLTYGSIHKAADVLGLPYNTVRQWARNRRAVPPPIWDAVIQAAVEHRMKVSRGLNDMLQHRDEAFYKWQNRPNANPETTAKTMASVK